MKRRGQSDRLQTRGQPYIGDFAAGVNVFVGAAGTHSQSPAVVVGCAVGAGAAQVQKSQEQAQVHQPQHSQVVAGPDVGTGTGNKLGA